MATADIAATWRQPAEEAVAWLNQQRGAHFELTGLVEPTDTVQPADAHSFELGLILCDGDLCTREQVRVTNGTSGFEFAAAAVAPPAIPPLLDPPVGVRAAWLEDALSRHDFLLLLFYRGRW